MSDRLTWAQMEDRYPDEWVLIADPETDELLNVLSGVVAAHNPDKAAVDSEAMRLMLADSALLFLGEPDSSVVYAL